VHTSNIPGSKSLIHIPSLRSFIQRIWPRPRHIQNFCSNLIFYGEMLLAPCQAPNLEYHLCHMSAGACSMCSQLPSLDAGHTSICHLRSLHAVVTRVPVNLGFQVYKIHLLVWFSLSQQITNTFNSYLLESGFAAINKWVWTQSTSQLGAANFNLLAEGSLSLTKIRQQKTPGMCVDSSKILFV
jgi:hypothetical protein